MANTALTDLTANTTPALTDILYLVDDPSGTPLSQKITLQTVLNLMRAVPYTSKTADYPAVAADEFIAVNTNAGNVTITLPSVGSVYTGKRYVIKVIEASNDCIVAGTIDGGTDITLDTLHQSLVVVSNGTNWYVESLYTPA